MRLTICMAAIAALTLSGCGKRMTFDQLDATRANASYGLAKAEALEKRIQDLEDRIGELEDRLPGE
jgi:hypothetical protein